MAAVASLGAGGDIGDVEDFAGATTSWGVSPTNNATLFEEVDETSCARITDTQAALQERDGGATVFAYNLFGLLKQIII
jgi:hypothetical protein